MRNRSLMYLAIKHYDAAEVDARLSLERGSNNAKGLQRAARACYHLGDYKECQRYLQALLSLNEHDEEAKHELARTASRLEEQAHGTYSFHAKFQAVASTKLRLDRASSTKRVEVRNAGKRGRLFTTEAVKAGEPVLCEKAFWVAYEADNPGQHYVLIDLNTNRITLGGQDVLLTQVIQMIYRNPSLGDKLLDLYAGSFVRNGNEGSMRDGVPITDM